jgi:curved DNA-binding protein CbpA
MKDYYKILGVEEEASQEEIRARWIELTKHYHPDLGKTRGEDERIKQINEAYEVLKDYSKRLDYDFERDLKRSIIKKGHYQKDRRFNIQKMILPAGFVVLILIVGLVVIRWPHVSNPPKSDDLHQIEKVLGKRAASQTSPEKPESPPSSSVREELKRKEEPVRKILPKPEVPPSPPVSQVEKEPKRKEEPVPRVVMKPEAPAKVEKEVPREVPKEVLVKEEPKRKEEPVAPVVMRPEAPAKVEKGVSKEVPKEVLKEPPKEVRKDLPKEVSKVTLRPGEKLSETWVVSAPSPSFAKEEEVKQFFSNYIDRYNRKDINGFLSLFSSKAVQNQKEGLDRIRKIYSDFFDQSQEVQYHMEDTKIGIYQNGVEVRARYKLDQLSKKGGERKSWIGNIRWTLVKEDGNLKISSLDYQNEKSP